MDRIKIILRHHGAKLVGTKTQLQEDMVIDDTRTALADEVEKMKKPFDNHQYFDGYNQAITDVTKVLRGK